MAVAVKGAPQTASPGLFDRLAVASLAGVVYVLGSIGIVFYGLPALWENAVVARVGWLAGHAFVATAGLLVLMVLAGAGLAYLGLRLVGPRPPHGLRAGVFVGLVGLAAIAFVAWAVGQLLESLNWGGTADPKIGIPVTGAVGLALLVVGVRALFSPAGERRVVQLEDQGWFSTASYKRGQGLRVRRGTILGILILAGCGIYTLLSHKALEAGSTHWAPGLPFSDSAVRDWKVIGPFERDPKSEAQQANLEKKLLEDARDERPEAGKDGRELAWKPAAADGPDGRVNLEGVLGKLRPDEAAYAYAEVESRWEREARLLIGGTDTLTVWVNGKKVHEAKSRRDWAPRQDSVKVRLEKGPNQVLVRVAPYTAPPKAGEEVAEEPPPKALSFSAVVAPGSTFMVLPNVRFTVPLLLALLALWLAWRVVNFAPFADFLIATEAEMNKVSWTTRKRLVQDTIVVLTTVVLFTIFLFAIDILWGKILSSPYIQVLRIDETKETTNQDERTRW